jgi:hypothetical protein
VGLFAALLLHLALRSQGVDPSPYQQQQQSQVGVPCHLLLQVTLLLLLLLLLLLPVCRQMVASQHLPHRLQQHLLPVLLPPCLLSLLLLLP